jgi:hypothetical protein
MKFLMIMLFTIFSFLTVQVHAISVVDQTTKVGQADSVKCADGLKCSVVKGVINLNAYHAAVATFASGDGTPSISGGTWFNTFTASQTITALDDGTAGKEVKVFVKGAITWDVTSTTLKCGSTDIVSASGDYVAWLFDGTNWQCTSFIDLSDNLN